MWWILKCESACGYSDTFDLPAYHHARFGGCPGASIMSSAQQRERISLDRHRNNVKLRASPFLRMSIL